MIQANELRIGNLLKNTLGEVFEVNAQTIQCAAAGMWPLFGPPQPIPLTPEILEQCGLKRDSFEDNFRIDVGDYNLMYEKNRMWLECGDSYYNMELESIKYLHQLQNLYFALTGEELKIDINATKNTTIPG